MRAWRVPRNLDSPSPNRNPQTRTRTRHLDKTRCVLGTLALRQLVACNRRWRATACQVGVAAARGVQEAVAMAGAATPAALRAVVLQVAQAVLEDSRR